MKIIKGLAMHLHHDILFEYCYDFDERVENIKNNKPINEQPTRLRVFKMLTEEAILALPQELVKAYADRDKAYADMNKAYVDREKAYAAWKKASADWDKIDTDRDKAKDKRDKAKDKRDKAKDKRDKAYAEWEKTAAGWKKEDAESWHKKYCGCKKWDGNKIVFSKSTDSKN